MATFTKLTLALFVVLVIGSCMVDARARKRNRNNNNNNNNNAADRRARRMFKWYGPVESEEECTAEGKPEDLELQGEARPNSICTEDGVSLTRKHLKNSFEGFHFLNFAILSLAKNLSHKRFLIN